MVDIGGQSTSWNKYSFTARILRMYNRRRNHCGNCWKTVAATFLFVPHIKTAFCLRLKYRRWTKHMIFLFHVLIWSSCQLGILRYFLNFLKISTLTPDCVSCVMCDHFSAAAGGKADLWSCQYRRSQWNERPAHAITASSSSSSSSLSGFKRELMTVVLQKVE